MSGGGQKEQTTTQQSSSAPWAAQQPYLEKGFKEAGRIYDDPSNPSYFPGQTYAPMSGETSQGLDLASAEAQKTASGYYMDPANNAGLRGMIDSTMARVVPGATSPFIAAGRTGSGLAARALGEGVASGVAPLYQAERDRMIAAPGQLGAVGAAREGYAQQGVDEAMARHDFTSNLPQNKLANYMQMIQGNYGGTNTSTGSTMIPQANPWMQALGIGSNVLGAGLGMYARSDVRSKKDISRVGQTDEGLPIYKFRYRDGGPMQMGVMAQEVARMDPSAVAMLPSGYLGVDYSKVS